MLGKKVELRSIGTMSVVLVRARSGKERGGAAQKERQRGKPSNTEERRYRVLTKRGPRQKLGETRNYARKSGDSWAVAQKGRSLTGQ